MGVERHDMCCLSLFDMPAGPAAVMHSISRISAERHNVVVFGLLVHHTIH